MPDQHASPDSSAAFIDGLNARNGAPASLIVCAMVATTTLGHLATFGLSTAADVAECALGALVCLLSVAMALACLHAHRESLAPAVTRGTGGEDAAGDARADADPGSGDRRSLVRDGALHRAVLVYLFLTLFCLTARLYLAPLSRLALPEYAIALLLLAGTYLATPAEWFVPLLVPFVACLIYALGDRAAGHIAFNPDGSILVPQTGVVSAVVMCALFASALLLSTARYHTALRAWEREALLSRQNAALERQQAALQQLNRNLASDASHDELTGLLGRTALRERFDSYLGRPLVCAIMDVDHFKQFNDEHGHDVGDAILREVAQGLDAAFGEVADVYRYGGDEFMVFAPDIALTEFLGRAQSLRDALRGPSGFDGVPCPTVSIGYVHGTPGNGADLRCMMRAMDAKLYETKSRGRNGIHGVRFTTQEAMELQEADSERRLMGMPNDATGLSANGEPHEMASYCGRTDEVTGLLNITAFRKEVLGRVAAAEAEGDFAPHCFVFLDIERFGRFNEEHGRQAGDDLLRYVGACVSNAFGDGVTSHFSADHFVAFVPAEGVLARIDVLQRTARRRGGTDVKAGVCYYRGSQDVSVGIAWERARQAVARIRHADGVELAFFEEGTA